MSLLRTIFALSRPARLPTVWSNCLAGWWLGGGGNVENLPFLFAGASLLYVGGAFLNDAFDAEHDGKHRLARPIPSGAVRREIVWRWGVGLLLGGALLLLVPGILTCGLGLALVFLIVFHNTVHRLLALSPLLKGLCRFFLYVVAASVAERGITGWSIWCGLALGAYMTAIGYLAGSQTRPARLPSWPAALLAVPIGLALVMDVDRYREPALLLSVILLLWSLRCLRRTFWSPEPNLPQTVAGLRAGLVFVDWLATCPVASVINSSNHAPRELSFGFIGLFLATLLLQRLAPED